MRRTGLVGAILAVAAFAAVPAASAEADQVPLYTSDDLDRMFGPVPAGPSVPVDRNTPEDWRWVEQFIDRQYARLDADRQWDLSRHALDVAAVERGPEWGGYYGRPLAWGLGYPASTWWNNVWGHYATATGGGYRARTSAYRNPYARAMGETALPLGEKTRSGGNVHGGSQGHGSGHGPRSK